PMGNETYPQMPYESITPEEYEAGMNRFPVDLTPIYEGLGIEAIGERFCSTDACEVKDLRNNSQNTREEFVWLRTRSMTTTTASRKPRRPQRRFPLRRGTEALAPRSRGRGSTRRRGTW